MALFAKTSTKTVASAVKAIKRPTGVLLLPVMSEKAVRLQKLGQYLFSVRSKISKIEAKKAIESTYGVRVIGVNSAKLPRKTVRRGRVSGQTRQRRHIIIRLAPGSSIELGKTV